MPRDDGSEPPNNWQSVFGGPAWTWDARPYPFFPELTGTWTDGPNWRLGHWLTGRLGAVSLAALLAGKVEAADRTTAVVLSGGNVDPLLMLRVVRHGLAAAGRYLSMTLRIPDRPGELARLLGELASVVGSSCRC